MLLGAFNLVSFYFYFKKRREKNQPLKLYMEKKINIDDLITHEFPLEEINTAFDLMHQGKSIRSVINY